MNADDRLGRNLLRESLSATWAHKLVGLLVVTVVAAMCSSVSISLGQAVGHQREVLATIDEAGSRAIAVSVGSEGPVPGDGALLDRIRTLEGVTWAAALSAPRDASNAGFPGGETIGVRDVYSFDYAPVGVPSVAQISQDSIFLSAEAAKMVSFDQGMGYLSESNQSDHHFAVTAISDANWLKRISPTALRPIGEAGDIQVEMILIVAESNAQVPHLDQAIREIYSSDTEFSFEVESSSQLAKLRTSVDGELASFARDIPLMLLSSAGVLVGVLLSGLVVLRRKDFGRRRALGAARWMIVFLVVSQAFLLSVVGALLGGAVTGVVLLFTGDPVPSTSFLVATSIYAVFVSSVVSMFPALVASQRDPVRELRVP